MKTILVPTDFSEIAERAYDPAASIALATHCKIVFHHNVSTLLQWSEISPEERLNQKEILEETREAAIKINVIMAKPEFRHLNCERLITHGITHEQILMAANRVKADLILLGSHADLPGRSFIDSNVQKVLIYSHCPVMSIGRAVGESHWKRLLVPMSFNEDVHKSFRPLHDLAVALRSTVHLLYINRPDKFKETSELEQQMKDFMQQYPDLQFESGHLDSSDMEQGILEYADRIKADYIAMVTHDHRRQPRYLISTTETIAYHSKVPLLSIPILKETS